METFFTVLAAAALVGILGLLVAACIEWRKAKKADDETERKAQILSSGSGGGGGPKEPA